MLDAGNLTATGTSPEKLKYVTGAYAQMPYDAVNIGAAEARLGAEGRDPRAAVPEHAKALDRHRAPACSPKNP